MYPLPLVIPKDRSINLGAGQVGSRQLMPEIRAQTLADLHSMLVGITREQVAVQMRLNNPPQVVEVDNRTNKPLDEAKTKTVVLFGVVLAAAAMRLVESALRQAIANSTRSVSGTLGNVGASWEWRFVPKGGTARVVSAGSLPAFQSGDRLVLVPARVPYATVVNRAVARSGRLDVTNATKGKPARGKGRWGKVAKASQNLGFLATASRALRRNVAFRQFAVVAEFTKTHQVPGELSRKQGTGVITIRPRFRRVKV